MRRGTLASSEDQWGRDRVRLFSPHVELNMLAHHAGGHEDAGESGRHSPRAGMERSHVDAAGDIFAIDVVRMGSREKEGGLDGEAVGRSNMDAPGGRSGTPTAIDSAEGVRHGFERTSVVWADRPTGGSRMVSVAERPRVLELGEWARLTKMYGEIDGAECWRDTCGCLGAEFFT